MAKLLNVNHDVYLNSHYDSFFKNVLDKNKLKFGDMIGVVNNVNKIKIIHLDNKLITPRIIDNKIIIDQSITDYIYNPILYYHKLAKYIYHINLSSKHVLFKKLLDSNIFPKLTFIFYYKTQFHVEIKNTKYNVKNFYKIDNLEKRDQNLINLMTIMSKPYIGIKKEIKINTDIVDVFYRRLSHLPSYWKIQSCNQLFKNNSTYVILELLIPECESNIIDRFLY